MTNDELRRAILEAAGERGREAEFVARVHEYYSDMPRAQATSRELMFLHLGTCCGMIMRLLEPAKRRS